MTRAEFQKLIAQNPSPVKRLYTDGGTIGKNPSKTGGTWAWCATDEADEFIYGESGYFLAPEGKEITNHQAEFAAMTRALEAMPNGWDGTICSDSELTVNRFSKGYSCFNIPPNMLSRGKDVIERLGEMSFIILQNKPTRKDIDAGFGKKTGLPVSKWNVWCDQKCRGEAQKIKSETNGDE